MYGVLFSALIFSTSLVSGCAYRFGLSERALPGGYQEVAIPVFKNGTQDVGVEMYFTNALIERFARSQVARVTDKDSSPLILEGTIVKIDVIPGAAVTSSGGLSTLPEGAVLTTDYRLVVTTSLKLKRRSDDRIMWQGSFQGEKSYSAPRIGTALVNSANATYNHSVRMQTISAIADDMMTEAHDRMTENF